MPANSSRLEAVMKEQKLDAVVGTTLENVTYLTGICSVPLDMFPHSGQSFVIISADSIDRPHFISSRCEVDQHLDADVNLGSASAYGDFFRHRPEGVPLTQPEEQLYQVSEVDHRFQLPGEALTGVLADLGLDSSRIAVDMEGLSARTLDMLRERTPGIELDTLGSEHLRWVRKVKTEAEIELISRSAHVAEAGIRAAVDAMVLGITEIALVDIFNRTVAGLGARPHFTLIKIGRNAVAGQTLPTNTPLQQGDSVWFDVGGTVSGYWYDIARVFSLDEGNSRATHFYDAMLAGVTAAISDARAGMRGSDLFQLTVDAVKDAGVPHYRRNHVGHGIGVEVYDRVLIRPDSDDVLEEGTVVNIETPYYEYGLGAVHVEDPFVIRAGNNQRLTTLDQNWGVVLP